MPATRGFGTSGARAFIWVCATTTTTRGRAACELLQHFQRARGDARRARHATSCSAQLFARSSEWRARRRLGAGGAVLERARAIRCDLQRVWLPRHAFACRLRACRRASATDWGASREQHGGTLLCAQVKYYLRSDWAARHKVCEEEESHELLTKVRVAPRPSGLPRLLTRSARGAGGRADSSILFCTFIAGRLVPPSTRTEQRTSPPSPLRRRRRGPSSHIPPARRRGELWRARVSPTRASNPRATMLRRFVVDS